MGTRRISRPGVPAGAGMALAVALLTLALWGSPDGANATHSCADTGSPFGPFNLQAYEAADYRNTYGQTLELAGYNALFPEIPGFALPPLETGGRSEGSQHTTVPYIPPVLLKAIAWIESSWAQADANTPYGAVGPTLVSHDCGYGIMQITSGMQNVSGVPNLEQAMIGGHYAFNIARGAKILADKWNLAPEYRPIAGNRDPTRTEDWYFALWGYNGFALRNHPLNPDYPMPRLPFSCGPSDDGLGHDRSQYPYQELVIGCAAHPPVRNGSPLWQPVDVGLPDLSDPAYAEPLRLENWNACSYQAQCAAMDIPTPGQTPTPTPSTTEPGSPSPSDGTTPSPSGDGTVAPASVSRTDVIGAPALAVAPESVSLAAVPPTFSETREVVIANGGTGVLTWRATASQPWVRLSRYQGVALGADLGSLSSTLTVTTDTSGLAPGTYTATVTIESLYASGTPRVVQVLVVNYPEGTLVRGAAPEVYRLSSGVRRHVPNVATFEALGLDWASVTALPDSTLAAVTLGSPMPDVLATGRLLRAGGPEVYVMDHGVRRHITSPEALAACGYGWEGIAVVSEGTLGAVPLGAPVEDPPCPSFQPPDGSLLRGSGPQVYRIQGGLRRHIPNVVTFEALGLRWGEVDALPDWALAAVPIGAPLLDVTLNGNLLRGPGPEVYVMQNGERRHVQSPTVMAACGYGWDAVYTISEGTLSSLLLGNPLLAPPCPQFLPVDGTLIRGSGLEVYVVRGGLKRHIISPEVFIACGHQWGNVNVIPDSMLGAVPIGPEVTDEACA